MPNPIIKIGGAIAFFSSLTAGSYFLRGHYTKERINSRINEFGKTMLTSSDKNEEWVKRWKEYLEDKRDLWKLTDYATVSQNKDIAPKSFKEKCINNSNLIIENNQTLAHQIENWCTKSFKVEDLLKEKGINLLDSTKDEEGWKDVWSNYFKKNKGKTNPLNISSFDSYSTENSIPDDYKTNCNTFKNKEIKTLRDSAYETTKSWCTKKIK